MDKKFHPSWLLTDGCVWVQGLPRLRAKLPSRNWTIFLAVCTAVGGTIAHDRYRTSQVKQKWIDAVSHLSQQPLSPMALPRKVTVYLASPPGDGGTGAAREHFREYVKPILNAAAVDYDVVEARRMGELRFLVAEAVRAQRRGDPDGPIEEVRKRVGIERVGGAGGVVVVGRHSWKEYLAGVQEGWLGPLEASPPPPPPPPPPSPPPLPPLPPPPAVEVTGPTAERLADAAEETAGDRDREGEGGEQKKGEEGGEKEEGKKKGVPQPLLRADEFARASLPRDMPETLEPAGVVGFPFILGFLNTPVRMYRFVTRRRMADLACREAAAVALGCHRPFITAEPAGTMMEPQEVRDGLAAPEAGEAGQPGEIDALLDEEADWPGRVWKEERYRGEWTERLAVDPRIQSRLRRFFIPSDLEPPGAGH